MHKAFITLTAVVIVVGSLGCKYTAPTRETFSPAAAVMEPIDQFVDAFNRGDMISALAACDEQMSIIDDVPPHEWHGIGAFTMWVYDYDDDAKLHGITDGFVKIHEPKYINITGDHAYVVVPATYTYNEHGKPVKESGSILTVALRRNDVRWLITGWSWAKN
jgi:hypothetical protein